MKILVIGGGGREHALVWKLKQSSLVEKIWCAPGNGGIAAEAECVAIDAGDVAAVIALAEKIQPDLTVVGPELPLVNGLTDAFRKRKWPIVGPSKQAAQLEGSKIFSKEFLTRHKIPTAKMYGTYKSARAANAALAKVDWPVVIKADGLCAGKGVFLAPNAEEAKDFIERVMEKDELGSGGKQILLEETLKGEELSFIILTRMERVMRRSCRHGITSASTTETQGQTRVGWGRTRPTICCRRNCARSLLQRLWSPLCAGWRPDGIPYQGFLYIGLMLTKSGPQVLEFNCRLGDPETQAIVARMDFDLAEVLKDVADGKLDAAKLRWKAGASVCVVLASGGYPGKFEVGKRIEGLTSMGQNTSVKILHAGTRRDGDVVVTNGGRVLGVTASGASLNAAVSTAYKACTKIRFDGMHYRKDIGAHGTRLKAAGD